MNFEIGKEQSKNGSPKRYRLELSLTGALGLGTVLVLGLVWVFIFGVLVGRGYQPEKAVPELARIMPEEAGKKGEQLAVIQPEELTFLDTLRDEPRHGRPQVPQDTAGGRAPTAQQEAASALKAEPAAEKSPEPQPQPASRQVAAVTPQPEPQQATQPPQAQKPATAAEAKPAGAKAEAGPEVEEDIDETRYNYVYQIASLSEPQSALRFRDQVRELGLKSEVKVVRGQDKYWHRVVVQFQGRPIDTRDMKAKLRTLGVEKPLLRSKVPVS